jgi:hypothetical protein
VEHLIVLGSANLSKRKPRGWHQHKIDIFHGRVKAPPSEPSTFEKLITGAGISEENAIESPVVVAWIRRYYVRYFVPEAILEALGLEVTDQMIGFQGEKQARCGLVSRGPGVLQSDS